MNKDAPGASYLTPNNGDEMGREKYVSLLLTAVYKSEILCGSAQACKNYYQMKQEETTWERYRAEANVFWAGGGGRHEVEATREASI